MHRLSLAVPTVLLALSIVSCSQQRPASPPFPIPGPADTVAAPTVAPTHLALPPGAYRYRLTQTAEIHAQEASDTVAPSIVTTEGLFHIDISHDSDSIVYATVSVDSIRIASQGSIPPLTALPATRLDSILLIRFSSAQVTLTDQIPDSLCVYRSLISVARLILLPELTLNPELSARKTYSETTQETSCYGGAQVKVVTTRRLRSLGKNPVEFTIEQAAELEGAGVLRRDSIFVTGSSTTRGTAAFDENRRLPSTVLTNSEGTITVQLGVVRTVFKQLVRQEIRQLAP